MTPKKRKKPSKKSLRAKSGGQFDLRAPLSSNDAFRAAHWLSAMAFVRCERMHVGSVGSYLKQVLHDFWYATIKNEKRKVVESVGVSLGVSGASMLIATGIGAAAGAVGGPIGIAIGCIAGAAVGGLISAVSIGTGVVVGRRNYKRSRKKIYDRLTKSNYDYRKEFKKKFKADPDDDNGHIYLVEHPGETLMHICQQYEADGLEFETLWSHRRNKHVRDYCRKKTSPQISQSLTPLKKDMQVWIPVKFEGDYIKHGTESELNRLTYLVNHTFRDVVPHIRMALKIYRKMIGDGAEMTGGVNYTPSADETIEDLHNNVKKQYPKLDFRITDIIYHEKNGPRSHWYETQRGDTLSSVAKAEKVKWRDIFEHTENWELQERFLQLEANPRDRNSRRNIWIDSIDRVYIPCGIPDEGSSYICKMREKSDGRLRLARETKKNYLKAGKPIWVPTFLSLDADSFGTCDRMIQKVQPTVEFHHHLSKVRNYLLPCLNMTRLYLDVFDELFRTMNVCRAEIEEAVLDYMKRGDHKKCFLTPEFQRLADDVDRPSSGKEWYSPVLHRIKNPLTGQVIRHFRFWGKTPRYTCIRKGVRNLHEQKKEPETYTVPADMTWDEVAAKKKVSTFALVAHNYRKAKVDRDKVSFDPDTNEWTVEHPIVKGGTTIEIPPSNPLDQILYNDGWKAIGIDPLLIEKDPDKFKQSFEGNICANASLVDVDIDELRDHFDETIDRYYKALADNREWHSNNFNKATAEKRRYYVFLGDMLHQEDMPGLARKIGHLARNSWTRTTKREKSEFATKSVVSVIFGMIGGAATQGKNLGFQAAGWDKGVSHILKQGLFGVMLTQYGFPQPTLNYWAEDFKKEGYKVLIKQGVGLSWTTGKAITKGLINGVIAPKLMKLGYDGAEKERITDKHLLDFRRERVALSSMVAYKSSYTKTEDALKEAAKKIDDLFPRLARHVGRAIHYCYHHVGPRLDKLDAKEDEPGKGLTGCRDCYRHLADLYEFQHELDKAERYLLSAVTLTLQLCYWETFLSQAEEDIQKVLDDSAAKFIAEGNHENCRKKSKWKPFATRHCYGPSEKDKSSPAKPLMDRPPAPPKGKGKGVKRKVKVSDKDRKEHKRTKRGSKPLPAEPKPKKKPN